MLYKIVGVLFVLSAMVFAADALRHAWNSRDGSIKAIAYAVLSVFLIEMVRVLQAEKHRRDDETRERRRLEEVERLARQAAMVD